MMTMLTLPALVLGLALGLTSTATPTLAQDKLECSDPQTQMDMNQCASQDYETADAELNAVWSELRQDRGDSAEWEAILEAQRLWIPFRDAHCEAEAAPYEGGSIQPLIRLSCLAGVTNHRTAQLTQTLRGL